MPAITKSSSRHPLVLYRFMLDRWWPATLLTGIMLLGLAAGLAKFPGLLPQYDFMYVPNWKLWILAGSGGFALIFSIFFIILGRNAYVQLFEKHLCLTTPFLRLNIAYNRINRTSTTQLHQLFSSNHSSKWQKELLRPLAGKNVVLLELSDFPIPRKTMLYFLSPFFFPDNSPKLALLVPDWIKFSTELESKRFAYKDIQYQTDNENPRSRLLHDLNRSRK